MRKNPTQQTDSLVIDGETYVLFFDFEAIADAEELTGLPLISGLTKKDVNSPRISFVRALLYACIRPHQPKVTYEEAAAMVNQWNWSKIWERLLKVWVSGMKEPGPETEADPQVDQG
jgi:hypothetical protein